MTSDIFLDKCLQWKAKIGRYQFISGNWIEERFFRWLAARFSDDNNRKELPWNQRLIPKFLLSGRWKRISREMSEFLTKPNSVVQKIQRLNLNSWEENVLSNFIYMERLDLFGLPIDSIHADAFPALFYKFAYGSTHLSPESRWDANQFNSSGGCFNVYLRNSINNQIEKRIIFFGVREFAYAFVIEISISAEINNSIQIKFGILAPSRDYRFAVLGSVRTKDDEQFTKEWLENHLDNDAKAIIGNAFKAETTASWLEAHDLSAYELAWSGGGSLAGLFISKGRIRDARLVQSSASITANDLKALGQLNVEEASRVTQLFLETETRSFEQEVRGEQSA